MSFQVAMTGKLRIPGMASRKAWLLAGLVWGALDQTAQAGLALDKALNDQVDQYHWNRHDHNGG